MIRYIAGLVSMSAAKEVYVRDSEGATAKLFVGSMDVLLTPEEMRHLAKCISDAAARAEERQLEQESEPRTTRLP